jgi:hypothetical protein
MPDVTDTDRRTSMGGYWMSHSSYDEADCKPSARTCMISIVFDSGAQHAFSGIHLTIVYQENKEFNNLVSPRCGYILQSEY